eukprot:6451053-Amphidinium_carterae.1
MPGIHCKDLSEVVTAAAAVVLSGMVSLRNTRLSSLKGAVEVYSPAYSLEDIETKRGRLLRKT